MLRIAVIGAGNHSALHHGSALQEYAASHPGEIELAAVCDLDLAKAREYSERFGFAKAYEDYRAMLGQERPDGLVSVTRPEVTARITPDLLSYRIPLLLEKPPGETSAQTAALLEAARRYGTPHMVSLNRRFIPAVRKAREWLAEDARRAPRILAARMLRAARREAGFAVGTGIHLIDTVLFFMGNPQRIVSLKSPTDTAGRHLFNALFDFGAGRSASVIISPDVGTEEETFEIHGQDCCILIDSMRCSVRILEGRKEVLSWQATPMDSFAFTCGSLGETESFLRAIRDGRGFTPDLSEAMASMLACEATDRAADGPEAEPLAGTAGP